MTQAQFDRLPFLLTRAQVLSVDAQLWEWKVKLARQTGALRTWKVDENARWHRYLKADVAPLAGVRMEWVVDQGSAGASPYRVGELPELVRFEVVHELTGLCADEICRAVHAGRFTLTCYGCKARYHLAPILAAIGYRDVPAFGSRAVDEMRVLTTDSHG